MLNPILWYTNAVYKLLKLLFNMEAKWFMLEFINISITIRSNLKDYFKSLYLLHLIFTVNHLKLSRFKLLQITQISFLMRLIILEKKY